MRFAREGEILRMQPTVDRDGFKFDDSCVLRGVAAPWLDKPIVAFARAICSINGIMDREARRLRRLRPIRVMSVDGELPLTRR